MRRDGYLYALEFDDGTLKVGKTSDITARMKSHTAAARRFGIRVIRQHVSPAHQNFSANEELLLERMGPAGRRTGTEYFDGRSFDEAVEIIESLPMEIGVARRAAPSGVRPAESADDDRWKYTTLTPELVATLREEEKEAIRDAAGKMVLGEGSLREATAEVAAADHNVTIWIRAMAARGVSERDLEQQSGISRMSVRKRLGR